MDATYFEVLPNLNLTPSLGLGFNIAGNSTIDAYQARKFVGALVTALDATAILGLTTNLGFLRQLVDGDAYRDGAVDTAWLDRNPDAPPSHQQQWLQCNVIVLCEKGRWAEAAERWREAQQRFPAEAEFPLRLYEAELRVTELTPAQGDALARVVRESLDNGEWLVTSE